MIKVLSSLAIALILSVPAYADDVLKSALTGKTLITGDVVTVADIFTNTGLHGEYVLAPAPLPGTKLVLGKRDLLRIVRAFKLDWTEANAPEAVTLERAPYSADIKTVKIPVLKFSTAANSLIKESDIIEIDFPEKQLRGETIVSKKDLIGMTTRRSIMANQSLALHDVNPPLMVKRNELITVIYKNGPVLLSSKARSMANGAEGDTITLMNITSKKSFTAKITGPQQAEVNVNI